MAKLRFTGRSLTRFAALASALFVLGFMSLAPANASAALTAKGLAQKPGTALHLGGVSAGLRHEFTIVLKSPSRTDAQTVVNYLRRFNMTATVSATGKFIHVAGTFGSSAAAAGVQFERVKVSGETFVRTNGPTHFPPDIQRLIAGTSINPGVKMRPLYVKPRPQAFVAGPQTGYGPGDFAGIYHINPLYGAGINGTGSTVDIAACFNIDPADIAYFESFYGLPSNVVHVIHIDGTLDMSGHVPPSDLEPTLDVERVIATAPKAKVNLYVVPDCLISQFVDLFAAISEDENADAMSVSYGLPEADYGVFGIGDLLLAQNAALQDVANEHIASFAASGDSGSWGDFFATGLVNFLDVLYPASDPNIISVGGTTVEETVIGTRLFEYAWGGSGGGVSGIFPISPWQAATPGVASGLFKNLPDVSLDADLNTGAATAWQVSFPPPVFPVGGTSVSSPTWAGVWALVAQNRRLHGHSRLPNAAASLYSLRGSAAYYDITVGANGYYPARAGYDNVTGLGVPDVAKLVKALQ